MNTPLGLPAAVTVGICALVMAACSGSNKSDSPAIESGTFDFVAATVSVDSCWPGLDANPAVLGISVPITLAVSSTGGFLLTATGMGAHR